jgi:hypothetical protein
MERPGFSISSDGWRRQRQGRSAGNIKATGDREQVRGGEVLCRARGGRQPTRAKGARPLIQFHH